LRLLRLNWLETFRMDNTPEYFFLDNEKKGNYTCRNFFGSQIRDLTSLIWFYRIFSDKVEVRYLLKCGEVEKHRATMLCYSRSSSPQIKRDGMSELESKLQYSTSRILKIVRILHSHGLNDRTNDN
jgi:hypothetical protein